MQFGIWIILHTVHSALKYEKSDIFGEVVLIFLLLEHCDDVNNFTIMCAP